MHNELLHLALARVLEELRAGDDAAWIRAERALRLAREDDPEIDESDAGVAVILQEVAELERLVAGWTAGSLPLPEADKAILKRAMKALRKRLKLARLDDESSLGGRGMTSGRHSAISGVRAPEQYPAAVWELLLRLGKVRDVGHGLFEPVGDQD
jgi:hypothetical protein